MYVVVDPDSDEIVGPFETPTEANEYFTRLAKQEEWPDVIELIEKTGKPFIEQGDPFVFTNARSENLVLRQVSSPEFFEQINKGN